MPSGLAEFYNNTRGARKIIVVDLGFLGDSVHLVPALWEIKRHHPQAELHALAAPVGSEVLRLASCVDRVWPLELAPDKRTWREQWSTVRALRRERFDVAFNFGGNDRTIITTALTGARWRVAHAAGRAHFWNRWLVANWVPKQDPDVTVYEQRRRMLAACGFNLEAARFDLKLPAEAIQWAATVVPEGMVHLSLNSANPLKEWPVGHHADLLRILWREQPSLKVVATASPSEREQKRLRQLFAAVNDPRLVRLPERLSIAQLAGVLKRCRLHIGPDSGVVHLAMALGVPTLSFFRAHGAYRAWLPRGPAHHVMSAPCNCVDHHEAPCERLGRAECLACIEPNRVATQVRSQLK
jgi:ADP-heptose:LPS heptosyltransferase